MVRVSPPFVHDFQTLPNGELLWNASLVLLNYFQKELGTEYWKGKRVLEFGSGSGDLGFGLSLLGADVTCTEMPGKKMNDLRDGIDNLEAETKRTCGGSVCCKPLLWGEEGWNDNPLEGTFDVVVCAELVYLEETHQLLIWTWDKICTPDTIIYSIFVNRPFSWNFFVHLHDTKRFDVTQIEDFDLLGMDDTHFHTIRKKTDIALQPPLKDHAEGEKGHVDAEETRCSSKEKESDTEETAECTVEDNVADGDRGNSTELVKKGAENEDEDDRAAKTTTSSFASTHTPPHYVAVPALVEERKSEGRESLSLLPEDTSNSTSGSAFVERELQQKDGEEGGELQQKDGKEEGELQQEEEKEEGKEEEKELSLIELIDELLGVSLERLQLWVNICLGILLCISALLIYNESQKEEKMIMFLHIGFSVLVICLGASVSYVINAAQEIEREKKTN